MLVAYPPGKITAAIRHPHAVSANVWADESHLAIAVYDKHNVELVHHDFPFTERGTHFCLAVIGACASEAAERMLPINFYTLYHGQ